VQQIYKQLTLHAPPGSHKEYLSRLYKSVFLALTASQHEPECSNLLLHLPFHHPILSMLSHRIFSGYTADNSTDVLKYKAVVSPVTKARKTINPPLALLAFNLSHPLRGAAFLLCLSWPKRPTGICENEINLVIFGDISNQTVSSSAKRIVWLQIGKNTYKIDGGSTCPTVSNATMPLISRNMQYNSVRIIACYYNCCNHCCTDTAYKMNNTTQVSLSSLVTSATLQLYLYTLQ